MARGIISGKVRLRKPASCIVSNSDTEICDGSSRLLPPSFILELAGFLIVDSRHGSIDRVNYVFMVTSVTPSIEQYMPPAQARAEYRSAYVTLDPVAYLSSTTLVTQLAKQTHASPNVAITNGTDSYHRNQQFSITAITNSTGAISERYAYSAYGQPTILDASGSSLSPQVSSLNNRYTYTGREWDATLGLHYFRARWMSPSAGRFITRDPIGLVGGPNLHEFIGSYPLDGVDPTGLFFQGSDGPPLTPVSFPRWWQVPPQQPPPPPQPAPPPPPPPQPPTHPLPPSRAEYCGPLSMKCPKEVGIDNVQASVIGNSPRAAAILAMGGMTNGCVTFPSGIECTMSCQALKTTMSGDNPRELILAHEACHYCALKLMNGTRCPEAGLLPYLGTITLAPDPCVGRERPVTIGW